MAYMKSIVALLNIYVFLEDISKNASNTNKNMDDLTARLHIDKEAFEKCMQYAYRYVSTVKYKDLFCTKIWCS